MSAEIEGREQKTAEFYRYHLWFGEILGELLKDRSECFRFMKVTQNEGSGWFVIVGAWSADGAPIVCLAYGDSLRETVEKLGKRMAGEYWTPDKFAEGASEEVAKYRLW